MLVRVLAALSVLCVVIQSAVSNQCSSHANGCSIPFNLPYFYKKRFTPACNKHDVCYSCAMKYGVSRKACDKKLYSDAKQLCSSIRNLFKRVFCKFISKTYYKAVSVGGIFQFKSGSAPKWCSQSWVRQCLP